MYRHVIGLNASKESSMNDAVQSMGEHLSKIGNFMPFLFVFFIYLLVIRPQQKKEKKRQAMIAGLKKGDVVMTSSGIKGFVEKVLDQEVHISISSGVVVSFAKNCISHIVDHAKVDQEIKPSSTSSSQSAKKKGTTNKKKILSPPSKSPS